MVQANPDLKQQLAAMFENVAFQKVPDASGWGKPTEPNSVVEDLKKSKGKPFSDNAKNTPADVKAIS